MKSIPKISEAEWQVMRFFWRKSPATAKDVITELEPITQWKEKTILTLINRLVNKGVLDFEKELVAYKRMKEDLQLHKEILKNMAEGVVLVRTSDAVIVYANKKFEKMFGYSPGELIGKSVAIVNYKNDIKSAQQVANEIIEQLKQYGEASYEVQNVKKDVTLEKEKCNSSHTYSFLPKMHM